MSRESIPNTIVVDADGFTLVSTHTSRVRWEAVSRIVAYKVDLFAVDLICLGFSILSEDLMIETTEEDAGWKNLVAEVEARFRVPENWWRTVAFPTFETQWTTLWERDA